MEYLITCVYRSCSELSLCSCVVVMDGSGRVFWWREKSMRSTNVRGRQSRSHWAHTHICTCLLCATPVTTAAANHPCPSEIPTDFYTHDTLSASILSASSRSWLIYMIVDPRRPGSCEKSEKVCSTMSNQPANASFFSNYTIHRRHSQRTHTHPYEYTHANPTPRSIFEDYAGKSSRWLCRQILKMTMPANPQDWLRLPLKAQTPLNPEKFDLTGSRTQDLRCYRGSCHH
jgi:hypothetical protein